MCQKQTYHSQNTDLPSLDRFDLGMTKKLDFRADKMEVERHKSSDTATVNFSFPD